MYDLKKKKDDQSQINMITSNLLCDKEIRHKVIENRKPYFE